MQYRSLLILADQNINVLQSDIEQGINHFSNAVCEVRLKDAESALKLINETTTLCISSFEYGSLDIFGYIENIDIKYHPTLPLNIKLYIKSELNKLTLINGPGIFGPITLHKLLLDLLTLIGISNIEIEFIEIENKHIDFEWYTQYETAADFFWYLITKYKIFFKEYVNAEFRKIIFTQNIFALNSNIQMLIYDYSDNAQQLYPAYNQMQLIINVQFNQAKYILESNCLQAALLDTVLENQMLLHLYHQKVHYSQSCVTSKLHLYQAPSEIFHNNKQIRKIPQFLTASISLYENSELLDGNGKHTITLLFDKKTEATPIKSVDLSVPYAGDNYGYFFPFELNTQVIVSCYAEQINKFVIIGALPLQQQKHFVTNNNPQDFGFNTPASNEFRINDKNKSLHIQTKNRSQEIYMQESEPALLAINNNGDINFSSDNKIDFNAQANQNISAKQNIFINSEKYLQLVGDKKITICTDDIKLDVDRVNINSTKINDSINNKIEYNIESLNINTQNNCDIKFDKTFNINSQEIKVEAQNLITLNFGGAKIILNSSSISIQAAGISLNGSVLANCKIAGL